MPRRDKGTIAALADETRTDEAVVQCLYEEELAALDAKSSVKNFIGVIAARRVRERLTAARSPSRPAKAPSERPSRVA
ncbi:MAG TPA: DUF3562 domain-containing protein [Steroidobacteraceae bacterium]